jgi:hypothetical protein
MQISSILLDGLLCSSLFILWLFKAGKGNYDIPTYWLPTTLCYHSQIKLVKPLRLLLGQHLTHFTLVRKPSEISQVTIYTPLYLRIVDQYRYFICCGLDCLSTILKILQVTSLLNHLYCIIGKRLSPKCLTFVLSYINFNLGITCSASTRL